MYVISRLHFATCTL